MSRYQIKILRRAIAKRTQRACTRMGVIALILITVLSILNAETAQSKTITQSSPSVQPTTVSEIRPLGIALEEINYPYPVSFLDLSNEGQTVRMAYMDVAASDAANGRTIVLLHGRNFSGFYWQSAIEALSSAGYRVIVPDQVGFGKSSKPDLAYDFDLLAMNTMQLLDRLNIREVDLVGHSMGGMLAVRMARLYPDRLQKLILETPVGLEDYRLKVPPQTLEQLQQDESLTDSAAIEELLRNFVAKWTPERDMQFVQIRDRLAMSAEYSRWTRAMARTWQMIYREPIRYELFTLTQPTLLVIGLEDRIALGKNYVSPEIAQTLGNFPELGRFAAKTIPNAQLVELSGIGHIPHHESPEQFEEALLEFLN
jgi:pimeloyl-ACP methyl ester carboxylesterase